MEPGRHDDFWSLLYMMIEFHLSDLFTDEVWNKLVTGQKRALGYLFNNEIRTSSFLGNLIELVDEHSPAKYKFK